MQMVWISMGAIHTFGFWCVPRRWMYDTLSNRIFAALVREDIQTWALTGHRTS